MQRQTPQDRPGNLTVRIPDAIASRLAPPGSDLDREALEARVLKAFRAVRITKSELRQALGSAVLNEVDGFLKAHGVFEPYTAEEFERELQALARLGS